MSRNSDQMMQQIFAQDSGGKAFATTNGLSQVIDNISSTSSDFYTLSYTLANPKMDGGFRKIEVKVNGDKYALSYRRGYYAEDAGLPGAALTERNQQIQRLAAQNPSAVDRLLPFMDLGMPQSQQILFKTTIHPLSPRDESSAGATTKAKLRDFYSVDFAVDLKDLDLNLDPDGLHKGTLNVSLIAYDRYGNIVSRSDHAAALNVKPDIHAIFQKTGLQLHAEIGVPKGQFWLRTGVYDQASRRVGTMEIPLSSIKY